MVIPVRMQQTRTRAGQRESDKGLFRQERTTSHASGNDNRSRHCQVGISVHGAHAGWGGCRVGLDPWKAPPFQGARQTPSHAAERSCTVEWAGYRNSLGDCGEQIWRHGQVEAKLKSGRRLTAASDFTRGLSSLSNACCNESTTRYSSPRDQSPGLPQAEPSGRSPLPVGLYPLHANLSAIDLSSTSG